MITKKVNDGRRLGKMSREDRRLAKAIRDTYKPCKFGDNVVIGDRKEWK